MPSLPSEGGQRPADGGAGGRISGEGLGGWDLPEVCGAGRPKGLALGARKTWRSSPRSDVILGKRLYGSLLPHL